MDKELAIAEYHALRTEERDRIIARLQIWAIFVSLVSIFGVVSLQSGLIAYIVALFPLLCLCLAFHAKHSEDVLHQIRKYLYRFEQQYNYQGYEHFVREHVRSTHGGYLMAIQLAFAASQLLALAVLVIRLQLDDVFLPYVFLAASVEILLIGITWCWLRKQKHNKKAVPN